MRARRWFVFASVLSLVFLLWLYFWVVPFDRVVLANNTGAGVPAALVDGQRASCIDDEVRRGTDMTIGNLVTDAGCVSEVAVFSRDNAMNLVTPISSWTSGSDILTITQQGLLQVPLTVWTLSGSTNDATTHAARADQIYNEMQGGIRFSLDIHDVHVQTVVASVGCEDLGTLKARFPPVAGRITVYYVPEVTAVVTVEGRPETITVNGRWCGNDPNIVLMGAFASETLAHELGHAFSLDHIDPFPSLPTTNVMFGAPYPRDSLTTGQVFRINVDTDSRINQNASRTGPTRSCPDTQTDRSCPALTLDVLPK